MNILLVGMRRCGTTILFDCLYEDKRFDSYYEPFCYGRVNVGGGSNMKNIPFGDKLKKIRNEFIAHKNLDVPPSYFNLGAPQDFHLEFEEEIPQVFREYLHFISSKNEINLMKFVRVSFKMKALSEIFPYAKVIHITKDPRRVVMSHIFGRKKGNNFKQKVNQSIKHKMVKFSFFKKETGFNKWSSEQLINHYIKKNPEYSSFRDSRAYEKIMRLWKILYSKTRDDGIKYFQSNYLEVNLEELCDNPIITLDRIYMFLGLTCPDEVKNWARANIRPSKPIYRVHDKRWNNAAVKIGIKLRS